MSMIESLLMWGSVGPLVLRLVLGIILLVHGWPKLMHVDRWEDDVEVMGFAPGRFWGPAVAVVEVVGALMLVAGVFTQVVAALLVIEFAVILCTVKKGESLVSGYEFELLILAVALSLVFTGPGVCSVDNALALSLL